MKKIILAAALSVLALTSACGKEDNSAGTDAEEAVETVSVSAAPVSTAAGDAGGSDTSGENKSDSTNMERIDGSAVSGETVNEASESKTFIGGWRSVSTTSDNASFTFLELDVTDDGYVVTLTFDDGSITSYKGKYEVNDGVLKFDDSFIGCTAYFYNDDPSTLVVDNGSSLVLCEHLETEEEMEATKRGGGQ